MRCSWRREREETDRCKHAESSSAGDLTLGHLLDAAGIDPAEVVVLRHTYSNDEAVAPQRPQDVTSSSVLEYTRCQHIGNKLGRNPARIWLVFAAVGGRNSRLVAVYENGGELIDQRTESIRYFDLRETDLLGSLVDRLVITWSKDTINWAKRGARASAFPVVEIADREAVPFPGFDKVKLSYAELKTVVADSRYATWRTALTSVQGIYLIADTHTGRLYVGKADGGERILGRWTQYAHDGHGGNVALRELVGEDADHPQRFRFSLLRVFGPTTPGDEIDAAESHWKEALVSREHGYNRN